MVDVPKIVIRKRKQDGFTTLNGVSRSDVILSHPSRGGSRGYELNYRRDQMNYFNEGIIVRASLASIYRWRVREVPHQMTGNTNFVMIRGLDLFHLIMYRMIFP